MGGGGSSSSGVPVPGPSQNYPAYKAGVIGENMWDMTSPTRSSLMDIYTKFLNPDNNYNISNLPGYGANYNLARTGVEDAYNAARGNIMANTPRGGALYGGLADLELNRAKNLGNAQSQLTSTFTKDIMDKSNQLAFTTAPAMALQGLGINAQDTRSGMNSQLAAYMQSQQISAAQDAAAAQSKGSGMGLLGAGLGSIFGMGTGGGSGSSSILGSGMSALSGLGSGKGGGGITSGLGGYTALQNNAMAGNWGS
jgi:hypothetical protein